MEDFRDEIAAKEVPRGVVEGGANVVLVARDELADEEGGWTICKDGTVQDEGLVGQGMVGDEDEGLEADTEGNDGSVLGMVFAEKGLHLRGLAEKYQEVAEDGYGEGSTPVFRVGFSGSTPVVWGFD